METIYQFTTFISERVENSSDNKSSGAELAAVKIPAMTVMFFMTMAFGMLPLKLKAFKENQFVLALANGFSGGLFLSVGLLHLLPEANENFEDYFEEKDAEAHENGVKHGGEEEEHFPWAFLITVLSFALILFIEKISTNHQHSHGHGDQNHSQNRSKVSLQDQNKDIIGEISETLIENDGQNSDGEDSEQQCQKEEEIVSQHLNIKSQLARSFQKNEENRSQGKMEKTDLTPYILQIAIGIHALFEGIAIGIQTQWSQALGIALAVIAHKWAEAMTLGISFRKANIEVNNATIMIAIQAFMNPIGIGLGWIMSDQGDMWTGIFTSISAGTFIYIASMEVLVEEFNLKRYKWPKFIMFLVSIPFISMLWVLEQLTED
ncbi:hypothetical protein PPERSA_00588 [Pseudocohnilembus persalinus]|uniref:Zinc/iron permease n=1 Tax=Pseudocohnilembus persalinus TaxID=266149 RepID=A0A0V0QSV8_PSEPJ|nr:hypothetical protein PPERSA_00588 [Pseudocohnilembus persalinus]|eukprot:KRX05287.1 hypothetical protein PPERSA_00588 [Pseudocohnilembus persalinus]